jgi:hypothetical protein
MLMTEDDGGCFLCNEKIGVNEKRRRFAFYLLPRTAQIDDFGPTRADGLLAEATVGLQVGFDFFSRKVVLTIVDNGGRSHIEKG